MKWRAIILVLLPFIGLGGCSGIGGANASLKIVNNLTNASITAVYTSNTSIWGPNVLDVVIPPGSSHTITGIPADHYDLKAYDGSYYNDTWIEYYVAFNAGATVVWTISSSGDTLAVSSANVAAMALARPYQPNPLATERVNSTTDLGTAPRQENS